MEESNNKIKDLMHKLIEVACNAKDNVDEALVKFAAIDMGLGEEVIKKISQVLKYLNAFSEKREQLEAYKDKGLTKEQWFEKELNRLQDKLGNDSETNLREVLHDAHSKIIASGK